MLAGQPSTEDPASQVAKASGERFTVRVIKSFANAEPFHGAWNDLVIRSGSDIYQTYEWCNLWWRHYGSRRNLQLLLYFSYGQLVGVIPAFTEVLWLGPVKLRVAKLIGADSSIQFCNLAVMPDVIRLAVSAAIRHLVRDLACDVFIVGPLAGPAARVDELLASGRDENELVVQCGGICGSSVATRFDLPGSIPEYLTAIGSRQRGNNNRSIKRLSGNHQVLMDKVSEPERVLLEFDQFQSLHETQWAAEGKQGHFKDWPLAKEFNRDLVEVFGKLGLVRFFRILADGEVASSQFCFLFGGVNYWRLPSRDCRPDWAELSLGKMGLIQMIEASISERVAVVEAGRGQYHYKLQLGGQESSLATIQFMRRSVGVGIRVKIFLLLASFLNLVYYRILFLRLAPKFPRLRHSLWQVWIRSIW